jgi:ribosomal protein S8
MVHSSLVQVINSIKTGISQEKDFIACRKSVLSKNLLTFLTTQKLIGGYCEKSGGQHYEVLLKKFEGRNTLKGVVIVSRPG